MPPPVPLPGEPPGVGFSPGAVPVPPVVPLPVVPPVVPLPVVPPPVPPGGIGFIGAGFAAIAVFAAATAPPTPCAAINAIAAAVPPNAAI